MGFCGYCRCFPEVKRQYIFLLYSVMPFSFEAWPAFLAIILRSSNCRNIVGPCWILTTTQLIQVSVPPLVGMRHDHVLDNPSYIPWNNLSVPLIRFLSSFYYWSFIARANMQSRRHTATSYIEVIRRRRPDLSLFSPEYYLAINSEFGDYNMISI